MNCIEKNIADCNSRYLLVISKSSISPFLLSSILEKLQKEYTFYIGSQFEDDQKGEFYSVKMLNKIQLCMEQGKVLVLKNLESIYPSLYDLFNQNFTSVGGKNFARIALGYSNNLLSYVNDNFRCVILVDQNELELQDPPFLNRFEKHIVSFEYLLKKDLIYLSNEINEIIKDLVSLGLEKAKIDFSKQLINCDLEEIRGIIYDSMKNKRERHEMREEVLKKIVPTFSQDIIASTKISTFEQKHHGIINRIYEIYNESHYNNLTSFLQKMNNNKNVVYTFSNILETILLKEGKENYVKNEKYGEIRKDTVKEILISSIKTENEIEKEIEDFYMRKNLNVCIFKFRPNDCNKINYIKFLIENEEKEGRNLMNLATMTTISTDSNINLTSILAPKKVFIFMIFVHRIFTDEKMSIEEMDKKLIKNKDLISHLSNYNQVFIDHLNGKNISILDIINLSNEKLFQLPDMIDIKEEIKKNLYSAFTTIMYNFKNEIKGVQNDKYVRIIIEKILQNEKLLEIIEKTLIKEMNKEESLINKIFNKNALQKDDIDLIGSISRYQSYLISLYLTKFIVKSERDMVLSTLLNNKNDNFEDINRIRDNYFNNLNISKEKPNSKAKSNIANIILGMNVPGSNSAFENVLLYVHQKEEEYFNLEDEIRNDWSEGDELKNNLEKFHNEQNQLFHNIYVEITKQNLFNDIYEIDLKNELNKEIYSLLIEDYLKIFLSKKFNCDYSEMEKLIKLLIEIRFKQKEKEPFFKMAKYILFLESNSKYIFPLLEIFNTLSNFIPDLYNKLEILLKSGIIVSEVSKRNPEVRKEVNEAVFTIFEVLLKVILSDSNLFEQFDEVKFFDFINVIKEISQKAMQIEISLSLFSKEIFSLQSFVKIIDTLDKHGKNSRDSIQQLIQFINDENSALFDNDSETLSIKIEEEYEYLHKILGEFDDFNDLIIFIFIGKIKQITDVKCRMKIIEIIFKENKYIQNAQNLFSILLKKYNLVPENPDEEGLTKEDCLEDFLAFTVEQDNLIDLFESQNNPILDEILFFLFDTNISLFFDGFQSDIQNTLFNISLDYLQKSLDTLEDIYNNKCEHVYKHLAFLYSISYIKCYLYHYVNINFYKNQEAGDFTKINEVIIGNSNNNLRKVIKIYILKLFRILMKNYDEFKTYDFDSHQIYFGKEFSFKEKVPSFLDYSFLDLDKSTLYKEILTKFCNFATNKFRCETKEFSEIINKNGIEIFFDVSVNKIISNLISKNYFDDTTEYIDFSSWFQNIIPQLKITESCKNLLQIYYNNEFFKKNIYPKISDFPQDKYEILLYSYKISIISSLSNENGLFQNFHSNNILKTIKENYIPGSEPNENKFITSYYEIESFIKTYNSPKHGAYICSCGQWYSVNPCGLPMVKGICASCKLPIGGEKHVPVIREGHFRIFKDEAEKETVLNYGYNNRKLMKWKLLSEFKNEVDKLINEEKIGIIKVSCDFFKKENKNIRNLSQVSYRVLQFVVYSNIYYANILGYIKDDEIKGFIPDELNILDMIILNWNYLKKALDLKGINHIQIFMNLIYPKLSELIINCPLLNTIELRKDFETKVNELIELKIKEYEEFYKKYTEENNLLMQLETTSMKSILHENISPEFYDKTDYPYLKYFMITLYPNKEKLKKELESILDSEKKYPIITNYLKEDENVLLLPNLIDINPFINYMINQYSYKITRDKAKQLIIGKELKLINKESVNKLYERFIKGWNNIKDKATKYKCRPDMPPKEIYDNDQLAYVLNDDGELYFGMYIAAAYQNFIEWQNTFLNSIKNNITQNGILYYFTEQISKEIPVQSATSSEIISLNLDYSSSFEEILYSFSNRNCFGFDGKVNYNNYKQIIFNIEGIEEEIGKIILSGKRLFKQEQTFVTYGYEGYRGGKTSVLNDYGEKYPQKELTKEEKKILFDYVNEKHDFNQFMFSLQMLIFFLQKENYSLKSSVNEIINSIPYYVSLSNEMKNFFFKNKIFTLEVLIDIYEYVEHLCFEQILDNVNIEFKVDIEKDKIEKINQYFNIKNDKRFISKTQLAKAVRKFISRFLSGKRNENEVKENENILIFLEYKPDLWPKNFTEKDEFANEIEDMMENFTVEVKQACKFYEVLGGDKGLMGEHIKEKGPIEQINTTVKKRPPRNKKGY